MQRPFISLIVALVLLMVPWHHEHINAQPNPPLLDRPAAQIYPACLAISASYCQLLLAVGNGILDRELARIQMGNLINGAILDCELGLKDMIQCNNLYALLRAYGYGI